MFKNIVSLLLKALKTAPIIVEGLITLRKLFRPKCPQCKGSGTDVIHVRPDNMPDPNDSIITCPRCNGSGRHEVSV